MSPDDHAPLDRLPPGAPGYDAAPGAPIPAVNEPESILVHPALDGWRLAILALVVVVPVLVLGFTTTVAVAAMFYWLAAIGAAGLVAITSSTPVAASP